jgi:hypothetical protein
MKSKISCLALMLCSASAVFAGTREYTILGNQKINAEVYAGAPKPAKQDGITVETAGFMIGKGTLIWTFDFTSKETPIKVVVEDVSGANAVVLVKDTAPKLEGNRWKGRAAPLGLNKHDCPWLFEFGDTTKVFRFTITLKGQAEPVILYQPAIYPEATKTAVQRTIH